MADTPLSSIPLTQAKYDELQSEKTRLTIERQAVMQRLKTAREMGDLSENGAYQYAKFELGSIGRQLRAIHHVLSVGKVTIQSHGSRIGFGSTVTLQVGTKQVTYQIVSEYESDPRTGRLSMTSPLGSTLIGKTAGETVTVTAPAGEITYTILTVA